MKLLKTTLLTAAALSLIAGTASAHPDKDHDKNIQKKVKVLKLNKDIQLDGDFSLEDIEGLNLEAMGLGDLDVDVTQLDDGSTKIIVRNGDEKNLFSSDKKKHLFVKGLRADNHSDNDVKIIMKHAEAGEMKFPHSIDLDNGMEVSVDKDGEVTVMKNGQVMSQSEARDHALSVEKSVTNDNGKKKIRVVIEMESED